MLPICLLIYAGAMTAYFSADWIASGRSTQFYISIAAEAIVIILLYIFLRKRENF